MITSSVCAAQKGWSGAGSNRRPSASQAGHIPSRRESCERYALSAVTAACRWPLLLLSPLLSATGAVSRLRPSAPLLRPAPSTPVLARRASPPSD